MRYLVLNNSYRSEYCMFDQGNSWTVFKDWANPNNGYVQLAVL